MAQFYATKMEPDENCASFGTRLEQKLNQVTLQYPDKISDTMFQICAKTEAIPTNQNGKANFDAVTIDNTAQ